MIKSTVDDNVEGEWNNSNLYSSTKDCEKEERIEFKGNIPQWLKGTLYRNGSGAYEINNDLTTSFNHIFDGFAFIQKYSIDGESKLVKFRGSFIKSHAFTQSLINGHLIVRQFGTDPCKSIFGRFKTLFRGRDPTTYTDDTGVTIQIVHNRLLALTETVTGNILDPDTLQLIGPLITLPYSQPLDSEIMTITTAHIMHDDKRQMTIGYSGRITRKEHWLDVIFISDEPFNQDKREDEDIDKSIFVNDRFIHITNNISSQAKDYNNSIKSSTKLFRFPYEYASYMHSASISEDYLILTEIPYHFNKFYAIWNSISGGTITDMFKWNGETMPTYFRIISLDTGEQIGRIPGPPFFTFHHINSYQTKHNKNIIIVDICAFDDPRVINEAYLDKLRENKFPSGAGYLRRFKLDLDSNTCIEPNANAREPKGNHCYSYAHSLVPVQFELARINQKYIGKAYRYLYGVRGPPNRLFDALIKLDVESKEQVALWEEPFTSPSEPIFVQRPDSNYDKEDDGIILSIVLDQQAKRSFILVLDAITFKELDRAYLPIHIPLSFHGNFY
ncbi:unnamed protein product [Rotaria sordida]|uniref:Uncharacterized protein n=1 Tax=Rotaria sordida TaxID=392033 RepID=A0A819GTF1_9BILA|nr:unnamed protein product [Rotaria sordida]CAF1309820.1 unnamed protein product [Rotaria sordida]CAF3891779.1 unnamed protein product [Rotaria sordida]CAF3918987.1 unnamed protein product [Rotaria sordida]